MVVEPTGCLAAAAAMSGAVRIAGKKVGVLVSGGNVDLEVFARLVGEHSSCCSALKMRARSFFTFKFTFILVI